MCGLTGMFDSRGRREPDRALVRRMNDRIAHRGPDGEGVFVGAGIALAHRRLAIIDPGGGQQPMFNEDGKISVIFNGEIYNYLDLAHELETAGHHFRSRCDTEVIVHAWEEWGADCVKRFRGMFAFALWDQERETLFLARDRLGKKPLYYACLSDGWVLFGSELKSLLCHPGLSRTLDPRAVEEYLAYGYVPDPRTIYRDVAKLAPAQTLIWRRGGSPLLSTYWDLRFAPCAEMPAAEARAELITRLNEAIRLRLMADVPLGAFLSGGVDSSGVVALMAGLTEAPVNTFSIAFGERDFDESAHAALVAERYRTRHVVREMNPGSLDLVDRLADIYDEPFGDASAMPTFQVCALAREHVTVALSGDGGDEMFAGYRRYLWHEAEERVRRLVPGFVRRPLFGALGALYPKMDWAPRALRARTTLQELALPAADAFCQSVSVIGAELRRGLYSESFRRQLGGYDAAEVMRRHFAAADTDQPLSQAQYADVKTWLPGDILVKVDRASMANSLEVRVPLLDHELVEWSAGLPPGLKLAGRRGKALLKDALAPLVPRELLERPKQGFGVPLARWFRGPLRPRLMQALPRLAETGMFDPAALRRMAEQHLTGRRDHGAALWGLLMFHAFLRHDLTPPARETARSDV